MITAQEVMNKIYKEEKRIPSLDEFIQIGYSRATWFECRRWVGMDYEEVKRIKKGQRIAKAKREELKRGPIETIAQRLDQEAQEAKSDEKKVD